MWDCAIVTSVGDQNKRLRVAYDTSVLGYAMYGAGGRTGVFRMAEQLARGLARDPDCELHFCGSENFRMWVEARRYLRADPQLASVPVLSYGHPARVYGFLGRWFHELAREKDIALPIRALRRGLAESLRAVDKRWKPLERQSLLGQDIFHSSFYPLPAFTQSIPELRRVLTVCDIINILQPEISPDRGAFLKTILSSLRPEDGAIVISQATKDDLCTYRPDLDPARVFVVPLAASEAFRPTRPFLSERAYFLSVCTLDRRKNLDGLVDAFAEWVRQTRTPEVDLVLVGSLGDSTGEVRKRIARHAELAHRIHLMGYVPDADLAPLYSGALAFVYPSRAEGFGLPVLEAMQCGTPVITSDRGALRELAEGAALLVDPESTDALAAALDTLYREPAERIRLSGAGMKRASRFDWAASTRALVAAYRALL